MGDRFAARVEEYSFRHYNNYVRYGKEEKIPDVPYYIRVTPRETNKLMTYARPPREPFIFSKVNPTLLPKQCKTSKKATNAQEKEVDKKELENETKYSAEYCKHNVILQPEPVTCLEDIPCHLLQARSLEPTEVITHLEDNTSLECPVSTIETSYKWIDRGVASKPWSATVHSGLST
ncbi:Hypothetical predicted protein [Pelobates cultripes]|uniref:Uncharacterized protein n=1 Tax=Pelobates cultripes TaxID=61616 RepID=A0AAD1THT3_PELCU|nr:Hypothetical predicted protein [Pelobates cultripes]